MLRERSCVDPLDARNVPALEIRIQVSGGSPVTVNRRKFFDDKAANVHSGTLVIEAVDAVIADLRRSHGNDLATVGRVGKDFLITGHGSIETGLAHRCAGGSK